MAFLRCFECGDSKFYGGCFFLIHLKLKIQPIISTPPGRKLFTAGKLSWTVVKKNIKKSGFKVLTHPCDMRYINVHLRRQAASFLKGIYQGWTAKARNACRRVVLSVCVIGCQIREDDRAF